MEVHKEESETKYVIPTTDLSKDLKLTDSMGGLSKCVDDPSLRQALKLLLKISGKENVDEIIKQRNTSFSSIELATEARLNLYISRFAVDFVDSILIESIQKADERRLVQVKEESVLGSSQHSPLTLFQNTNLARRDHPFVFDLANNFIDSVLDESYRRVANLKSLGVERFQRYNSPEDFCVRDGLELVERCISKWSFNPNWFIKINYNGRMISESHSYFYKVKWSVPTLSYPVAQVIVDMNFTVNVTPMVPPPVYIEVWYRLETDRSEHSALCKTFEEKHLHTVFRQKLQAFQHFHF